jgi:DNA-binding MarR family transcriptional regulator
VSALRLLARGGLIERVRNPKDRRTINIYLTDKARDMKSELMPIAFEVNNLAAQGLSDGDFLQLRNLLQKIRDNLASEEG